ncbi:hypothetical protein DesfrDRAFT_0046 [Solidesulfovibrio fructosivorans JJ]]|uniref:Uncharacterized protein n=1 Tax=Solidesulfovibrio fructosivorans JJ] TaxID=596151 RepID=E1JQZ7_SOLFR|nr:hypothetical protein [Solidesulfovibrio fructosivorans]EFL52998.1 hypothetical protein DesfrDRAFT_0046 [Solidesulfovibrio fructosivorans JJ]]
MPETTTGNTKPIFAGTPKTPGVTLTSADGTSKKPLLTAGANGTRVDSLHVATDDTAAADLHVHLTRGDVHQYLGTVPIPAGAGGAGVAYVEMLDYLNDGNPLTLEAGLALTVAAAAAITADKTLTVIAWAGDF